MIKVSTGGARTTPRVFEAVSNPVGKPRSRTPNQSFITFTPQGIIGASPIPRLMRLAMKPEKVLTKPVANWASDHKNIPAVRIMREPMRSSIKPIGSWAIPYANENTERSAPISVPERPKFARMLVFAIEKEVRSR